MKKILGCMIFSVLCIGFIFAKPVELLVYSGAGLKKAMEEIKIVYEKENDVEIQYVYAGSAQLLSQINLSGKGDVFIVGSVPIYKKAQDKKMAEEPSLIAHHTPCIAVAKGNPKNIQCLSDLEKTGMKIILGDPSANAIGLSAKKIIEANNLSGIFENTISYTSTVNELVTQLSMGQADASIVTRDSIADSSKLEMVEISPSMNEDQLIPIGILSISKEKESARNFVSFVASPIGKRIFKKHGFKPVD